MLGIVCLTLQSYITENRAAALSDLLYCAMFNDSPFTVELAESYNVIEEPLPDDLYLAAGRADPHSAAVCRVTDQINEGPVKLATGALVNINGRHVVSLQLLLLKTSPS